MASSLSPPISIGPASSSDLPELAHLGVTAMSADLLHRVVYPSNNPSDVSPQQGKLLAELQRQHHAGAWIAKATRPIVDTDHEEIVGFALMNSIPEDWIQQEEAKAKSAQSQGQGSEAAAAAPPAPVVINTAFMKRIRELIAPRYRKFMGGKRHIYLKFLMTRPDMQRMGVGSALLEHGFKDMGADQLPVWVITQYTGLGMYLKTGFKEVDTFDVDMAAFMGPHRGFGMHRNYCLIRESSNSQIDEK